MSEPHTVPIRTVAANEATTYNDFFRAGVVAHPEAFRITPPDFSATPFDPSPGENGFTVVATTDGGEWLGVVSVERERGRAKRRHIAWLVRMYVAATAAGRGVGRALLRAAIAQTQRDLPEVATINLTVLSNNEPAKRLYVSEGFTVFAHEPDALRDANGASVAEDQMRLPLTGVAA